MQPLAAQFLTLAKERGIDLQVVSTYRSPEAQQSLYTSGAGVTNAPALSSYHNYRLAFDVCPVEYLKLKDWNPEGALWGVIGPIGESVGLTWGGRWAKPDRPHFQLSAAPIGELRDYWNKFKEIMPISITPTSGGLVMALIVIGAGLWLHKEYL